MRKLFKTVKVLSTVGESNRNQINITEIDGVKHVGFVGTFVDSRTQETGYFRGGTFLTKADLPKLEQAVEELKKL